MPAKKPLTPERARELFDYEAETGILTRKIVRTNAKQGPAGRVTGNGYLMVCADNYPYYVHRIIWIIVTGRWPQEIDHIDLDRTNNKWSNLREATRSQNMMNRRRHRRGVSGRKGVHFYAPLNKWRSSICHDGKHLHLGYFDNMDAAAKAYADAASLIHGEFART